MFERYLRSMNVLDVSVQKFSTTIYGESEMTTFRIFKIGISNIQIHVDLPNIRLVHFRNPEAMKCPKSSIELVRGKRTIIVRRWCQVRSSVYARFVHFNKVSICEIFFKTTDWTVINSSMSLNVFMSVSDSLFELEINC